MDTMTTEALRELAQKIAAALGPDWTLDASETRWTHICRVDDRNCAFWLRQEWHHKGMLHIGGSLPINHRGYNGLRYNEQAVSINVSLQKTPEHIAKDIQRRLLPAYTEQYQRARAAVDAANTYEVQRAALGTAAEALIKTYQQAHPYSSRQVSMYLKHISDKDMNLELSGVTLAQLEAVIRVISAPQPCPNGCGPMQHVATNHGQ